MSLIQLGPDHNDTTERFKRHSSYRFSDVQEPRSKHLEWFLAVVIASFISAALVVFLPTVEVKASVPVAPALVQQPITPEKIQLSAFKACPPGQMPVWLSVFNMQCFKEKP